MLLTVEMGIRRSGRRPGSSPAVQAIERRVTRPVREIDRDCCADGRNRLPGAWSAASAREHRNGRLLVYGTVVPSDG
jgi:hypothetical protein